jgi:putative endonuclease
LAHKRLDSKTAKGSYTEHIAFKFLVSLGYDIHAVNWRRSKAEIDIIAQHGKTLVFVEVKSRSSDDFGDPALAVSKRKQKLLVSAATLYMDEIKYDRDFRFDIITVIGYNESSLSIEHYKDAFFPGLDF